MGDVRGHARRSIGRRSGLAVLVVLVVAAAAPAHAAIVVSETTWGGVDSEVTSGAAVASDGGSYLAGVTRSFDPFGQENVFLVKFAANGSLSWQRTFEGPEQFGIDRANAVAVGPDGSVYVTGQTLGVQGDVLLLKFAPDGSLLWQRRWDGGATESGEAVAVAGDGSVYVTGGTNSFGGFGHLFVLRFASDGTLVWQRIRSVATDEAVGTGEGIAVAADGSVYAAGVTPRPVVDEFDMLLLKLDPQGALVWQRAYSAADVADARGGVTVAVDGSVYVAGGLQAVTRKSNVVNDTFIAKFGPDGSLIWDRGYGGDNGDFPGGVAAHPDGTILIGGETASFGAGDDDAFLLQLDATGKAIACNSWGGQGVDHGDDVEAAPDGTIVLAATTESAPPFTFAGCPRQTRRLRGTVAAPQVPFEDATGQLADPAGTVATPGGSSPGAGGFDAALVRIAP